MTLQRRRRHNTEFLVKSESKNQKTVLQAGLREISFQNPLYQFPESTLTGASESDSSFKFQVSSFQFPVPVSRFQGHDSVDLARQYSIPDFRLRGPRNSVLPLGEPRTPIQNPVSSFGWRKIRLACMPVHVPDSGGTIRGTSHASTGGSRFQIPEAGQADSSPLPSFQTPHSENTDSVEDQIGTEGQSDRNGVRLHVSAQETRRPPDSMDWQGRLQRGAPFQDSSLQFQFRVSGLTWVGMARISQFTGLQITPEKLNCPLMIRSTTHSSTSLGSHD